MTTFYNLQNYRTAWVHPKRHEVLAVDEALSASSKVDLRKSQVVELRFFGGMSVEETAEVLRVSTDTVVHDWTLAKAWLLRELSQEKLDGC